MADRVNPMIFVDFPSPDPAASAKFYEEVFGWVVEPRPADVFYRIVPGGHFPLDDGSTSIRWCGPPSAVTGDLADLALRIAGSWTGGPGARPWLLESGGLAPNHWFSTPITGA